MRLTDTESFHNNFFFISGLPRTGSTLFQSIISQNNNIYTHGHSPVCQLMWDMKESCEKGVSKELEALGLSSIKDDLIKSIPEVYYKNKKDKIIFDKCRTWTLPDNLEIMKKYIAENPKIIIFIRPVVEIVESYAFIRKINGYDDVIGNIFEDNSDFLIKPLYGVKNAIESSNENFLFIKYEDLVFRTKELMNYIYNFLDIEHFNHDFNNIVKREIEDDSVYGLKDLHKIRSKISLRDKDVSLPKDAIEYSKILQEIFLGDFFEKSS